MDEYLLIRDAHLQFAMQNPMYDPEPTCWNGVVESSRLHHYRSLGIMYSFMETVYTGPELLSFARQYHMSDLIRYKRQDKLSLYNQSILKKIDEKTSDPDKWYFVTLGWLDTITLCEMKSISKKIFDLSQWEKVYAVNEKHRENGIHYHTHFLIHTREPKSKLFQYIKQVKGIRYLIANYQDKYPSSIDVKDKSHGVPYQVYFNYVHGIKKTAKMPYVEKDRLWRNENNFQF